MFRTLRRRLILGHVVPLLITVPLMGIALIYALETLMLLPSLVRDAETEARLVATIARDRPQVWNDSTAAAEFVQEMKASMAARLQILDRGGHLLASTDPDDVSMVGQALAPSGWQEALRGEVSVEVARSRRLDQEIVDVLIPVLEPGGQPRGYLRLSHHVATLGEGFVRLRYVIGVVMIGGLLLGIMAALVLALNLEQPLRRANVAVSRIARGEKLPPLAEQGPIETRELLRSVNALVERLHGLERARRELLANLIHELARPLGAVRAGIEAILRGAASEPNVQRELLEGMRDEVDRLSRLLDDLSGLRDQVLGTLELARRPTSLTEWLTHTLAPWRAATQEQGLQWQASIPDDLPVAYIDPERLGQALGNLISNALRYTPRGGIVTVDADVQQDTFWVRVSDTGPGIAPEEQARIFAPLYRSTAARRFPQGMGLGLTIARDLVSAHGGEIELESVPGKGSRFTIRIPLHFSHQA